MNKEKKALSELTLAMRVNQIEQLGQFELPYEIRRALPNFRLSGENICFENDGDYLSLEEAREVARWLTEQLS